MYTEVILLIAKSQPNIHLKPDSFVFRHQLQCSDDYKEI